MKSPIYFFTEGSHKMGMGHITRCQALGQAFEERRYKPEYFIRGNLDFDHFDFSFDVENIEWLHNIDPILSKLKDHSITIIDSYHAPSEIYQKIRSKSFVSVYFDDTARISYPDGILVNGAALSSATVYVNSGLKLLLGTKYQPVRKVFWDLPEKIINPEIEDILIMFGGTDIRNMTPKIVTMLEQLDHRYKKHVIIGPGTKKGISNLININKENTVLYFSPSPYQLRDLMLQSDIAISGAGQSLFELARTGTPTLAIEIVDNQSGIISYLENEGCLVNLHHWDSLDYNSFSKAMSQFSPVEKRKIMSSRGRKVIDGQGPRRIVDFIINYSKELKSQKK